MLVEQLPLLAIAAMAAKTRRLSERPPFECIALLLQGGGALGSYQAGVYSALAEAELQPDWVTGISSTLKSMLTADSQTRSHVPLV
jgi:hypothetical protein